MISAVHKKVLFFLALLMIPVLSGTFTARETAAAARTDGAAVLTAVSPTPPKYTYRLKFNDNGGHGSPKNVTKATSAESCTLTVPEQEPYRNGYHFTGWDTASDGSGESYSAGDSITLRSSSPELILYAKWTSSGGSGTTPSPSTAPSSSAARVKVKSITLNKKQLVLYDMQTFTMKAVCKMTDGSSNTVIWASSNKNVAKITQKGVITAVKAGTATISARRGSVTAKCKVTVKPRVKLQGFTLNYSINLIPPGGKFTLKVKKYLPANATIKDISWKSLNTQIATVSKKGVVTGKSVGECSVFGISRDGKKRAKCTVIVSDQIQP